MADPTPTQIAQRIRRIKEGWTQSQRARRFGCNPPEVNRPGSPCRSLLCKAPPQRAPSRASALYHGDGREG